MKTLLALVLGAAVGAGVFWYLRTDQVQRRHDLNTVGGRIEKTAQSTSQTLQEKLHALNLSSNEVKEEVARTGRVMRQNVGRTGQTVFEATADARITAAVKAKLIPDSELSVWKISVNTTGGVVTLSGSVPSREAIGKAILLAMDTDGVTQVISTLQVLPRS